MNTPLPSPDFNTPRSEREELEIRLTALLLGELPEAEAAELRARIEADPALAQLHRELRRSIELVAEASREPDPESLPVPAPPTLSHTRRERLLSAFRTAPDNIVPLPTPAGAATTSPPSTPATASQRTVRFPKRELLALAAMLVAVLGAVGTLPEVQEALSLQRRPKSVTALPGQHWAFTTNHSPSDAPVLGDLAVLDDATASGGGVPAKPAAPTPSQPETLAFRPQVTLHDAQPIELGISAKANTEAARATGDATTTSLNRYAFKESPARNTEDLLERRPEVESIRRESRFGIPASGAGGPPMAGSKPASDSPRNAGSDDFVRNQDRYSYFVNSAPAPSGPTSQTAPTLPNAYFGQDGNGNRGFGLTGGLTGAGGFGGGGGGGLGGQSGSRDAFAGLGFVPTDGNALGAAPSRPAQPVNQSGNAAWYENGRRSEVSQAGAAAPAPDAAKADETSRARTLARNTVLNANGVLFDQDADLALQVDELSVAQNAQNAPAPTARDKTPTLAAKPAYQLGLKVAEKQVEELAKEAPAAKAPDALTPLPILAQSVTDSRELSKSKLESKFERAAAQTEPEDRKKAAKDQLADVDSASPATPPPPALPQPEVVTANNPFSTFSLNVSDVSFQLAAESLGRGLLPAPGSIRVEEFINAFDYHDPSPAPGAAVGFAFDRARHPFAHNRDVLRLSVRTAASGREPGRPLNLVLLVDNSGSMERADRVAIRQECLRTLAAQLQTGDRISVVTFARTPRLWLDGAPADQARDLADRFGSLTPEGGTHLESALDLAYKTAQRHFNPAGPNRVILLTDGAANLGDVSPASLRSRVEAARRAGIALDCFGIGWEGLDDELLEQLSRNGDGRYGFINSPAEAASNFAAKLSGALQVAAADVKVQVEFNPRRVTLHRQVGYARHQLTKQQFRDNTVDAAELAAAESGNALYTAETNPAGEGPIATVRVRFKVPATGEYREQAWTLPWDGPARPLDKAAPSLRLAVAAATFGEWLAQSPFAQGTSPEALIPLLQGIPEAHPNDPRPARLRTLLDEARRIAPR